MSSVSQTDAAQRFQSGQPLQSVASRPSVSVLVPAKDEAENLPLFMEQAHAAFAGEPHRYEVVVIDDGSVDDTWSVLQRLASQYPFLKPVRHGVRRGIADALRTGYLHSRGDVLVFTLDEATVRSGVIAVGVMVSVRYRYEGSVRLAIAVNGPPPAADPR